MAPEDISSESDVSQSSDTSVADSSASSEQSTQGDSQQDAGSTQSTDNLPFNDPKSPMHNRFKELHEQAQSARAELEKERQERTAWQSQLQQQYEQRMQQIQQQFQPKQDKPFQPLLERLKGIDPEFAQLQEKALEAIQQLPTLNQQLEAMRVERDRATVNSTLSGLYSQFKIPDSRKSLYESALKAMAYENPKLTLKDIDTAFKQVHSQYDKFFTDYDREKLKGYVKEKKDDATPSTKTGGIPSTGSGSKKQLSKDEFRALVKQELRKGNEKI